MHVLGNATIARQLFNGENPEGAMRVVIATPCGMGGVYQAGVLHALHERGVSTHHIQLSVGLSAGSWNMTAFAAGQAMLLRDVYEHLAEVLLLQMMRGDFLGLLYLKRLLKGEVFSTVRLNEGEVRAAPHPIWVGVSDLSGALRLPDVRTTHDIYDLCHASSSIPVFGGTQSVSGEWLVDPACADPCPLRPVLASIARKKQPIDVVVIAGRPEPERYRALEQWFGNYMTLALMWSAWYSWPIISSALMIDEKMKRAFQMCKKERPRSPFRLCALVPDADEALPFTFDVNPRRVRTVGEHGYVSAHRFADT